MNDTAPHTISVPVEGDGVTYVWRGADAEGRHERWALDGTPTYDEAVPD